MFHYYLWPFPVHTHTHTLRHSRTHTQWHLLHLASSRQLRNETPATLPPCWRHPHIQFSLPHNSLSPEQLCYFLHIFCHNLASIQDPIFIKQSHAFIFMHDISNEPRLKCLQVAFEVGTKRIPAPLTTNAFLSFALSRPFLFPLSFFPSLNRTPVITHSFLTRLPCEHWWWFIARHLALPSALGSSTGRVKNCEAKEILLSPFSVTFSDYSYSLIRAAEMIQGDSKVKRAVCVTNWIVQMQTCEHRRMPAFCTSTAIQTGARKRP